MLLLELCSKSEITGPTIQPHCQRDGATVECEEKIPPGTTATIQCKTGYRMPSMQNIHKDLICLPSGGWDYEALKCEPVCGVIASRAKYLIADGTDIEINEAPWHVAVYKSNVFVCAGTLISEKVILSSAYCFHTENSTNYKNFKVRAGNSEISLERKENTAGQIRNVDQVIIPEIYQTTNKFLRADIAVIIVKENFVFTNNIAPACLEFTSAGNQPPHGTIASVAGWSLVGIL